MISNKKFRSVKRKKRRGFFGKRPQDVAKESVGTDDVTEILHNGPRPGRSGSQETEMETIGPNKSQEKLLNTSFSEIEDSYGSITRSKSLELGKRTESIHRAKGLKILDTELLKNSLESAFICKNCENKDTMIEIMVDDDGREGLAESLIIICKHCGISMQQVEYATCNK